MSFSHTRRFFRFVFAALPAYHMLMCHSCCARHVNNCTTQRHGTLLLFSPISDQSSRSPLVSHPPITARLSLRHTPNTCPYTHTQDLYNLMEEFPTFKLNMVTITKAHIEQDKARGMNPGGATKTRHESLNSMLGTQVDPDLKMMDALDKLTDDCVKLKKEFLRRVRPDLDIDGDTKDLGPRFQGQNMSTKYDEPRSPTGGASGVFDQD